MRVLRHNVTGLYLQHGSPDFGTLSDKTCEYGDNSSEPVLESRWNGVLIPREQAEQPLKSDTIADEIRAGVLAPKTVPCWTETCWETQPPISWMHGDDFITVDNRHHLNAEQLDEFIRALQAARKELGE